MSRRPLVLALALALPAFASIDAASATDLMQTYELARSSDPQLAAAESGRLAQKEGAVQARANLLPQINGSASLNRSRNEYENLPGSTTNSGRSYGINVSQSVLDFSRYSTLRGQKALSEAADYDLESANDSLITRTSAAYFDVLVAIETLAAAEAQQTALQKQFDYAQKRLDVGLAPITDVHEARAQFDSARASVITRKQVLADMYQALVEITGQPITNLKALPEDFRPVLPANYDAEGWVNTAVTTNPALKSLEYQVQSADAYVSTARAGHLPTLSLGGSWGKDAAWGDSVGGSINGDATGTSVGLTLSVPIFSGGATQSRVREALANRDAVQDGYEQQKRAIIRNTRNAYQVLDAGISEIEARRLAVVSARAAYDASQVGLEVGTRTVLDVLINQQTLFDAQQLYALSKYNYLQNLLLLEQAAGTLDGSDVQDVNRLLTVDADNQLDSDGG
ncbi:MAG: TolC family outer membrane protein [Pseudoxanthomonas sp.]